MVCGLLHEKWGAHPEDSEVTPQAIYPIDAAQPYTAHRGRGKLAHDAGYD